MRPRAIQYIRHRLMLGIGLQVLLWGVGIVGTLRGLAWCEPIVGLHGVWLAFRAQEVMLTWRNLRAWEEELRGHES